MIVGKYTERLLARFFLRTYGERWSLWGTASFGFGNLNVGLVLSWPQGRYDHGWRIAFGLGFVMVELLVNIYPRSPPPNDETTAAAETFLDAMAGKESRP